MSSYSSISTNSSWLKSESIKALEIENFVVFNIVSARNTILSCFFFFFLIIDLYSLIPAVITKISIVIAELAIPTGIPTKDATAEIETHPITVEARYDLKPYKHFCAFYLLVHFALFFHDTISSFIYFFRSKFLTYIFVCHNFWYCSIILIKTKIFNILIDSFSLNICSSLLPHLLQKIERTNVFSRMYDILGFLLFLYLPPKI